MQANRTHADMVFGECCKLPVGSVAERQLLLH